MQNIRIKRFDGSHEYDVHRLTAGVIEPEDRSWLLFVHRDGSSPTLFLRTQTIPGSPPEDVYVASTGVFDQDGREIPARLLHKLGLRIMGRDFLEGVVEAWNTEPTSPITSEARKALLRAVEAVYEPVCSHPDPSVTS